MRLAGIYYKLIAVALVSLVGCAGLRTDGVNAYTIGRAKVKKCDLTITQDRPKKILPEDDGIEIRTILWHDNPLKRKARLKIQGIPYPIQVEVGDRVGELAVGSIKGSKVTFVDEQFREYDLDMFARAQFTQEEEDKFIIPDEAGELSCFLVESQGFTGWSLLGALATIFARAQGWFVF